MHRLVRTGEIPVELISDERAVGREQLREHDQTFVHGCVRVRIRRLPEARPRPADVPVRQVVDEHFECLRAGERVEVVERVGDGVDGAVQPRADPAIEDVGRRSGLAVCTITGNPPVEVRVCREERVRVPQRQEELARRFVDAFERHALGRPRRS